MSATERKYLKPEDEPRYAEALVQLQEVPVIGVSLLQRRLKIGFNQARRILDEMAHAKLVRMTEPGRYQRIEKERPQRLPAVVLVNPNGSRDQIDARAGLEFVFAADKAVRVQLREVYGELRIVITEMRTGRLNAEHNGQGEVVVTSN